MDVGGLGKSTNHHVQVVCVSVCWIGVGLSSTLLGTNISPEKSILNMIFLFPRWDMLVP